MSSQLIIGGDSAIGRELARALRYRGNEVITTSRRASSGAIQLDLTHFPQKDWLPVGAVSRAFLCAGITSIAMCDEDSRSTREVNVEHSFQAVEPLLDAGTQVVFLSTNLVFDGSEPDVALEEPTNPQTVYGAQKAEMEALLLGHSSGNGRVVRLTKVLGRENVLLQSWIERLRAGKPIEAFNDMVFAPISLDFVVAGLAMGSEEAPILHLSAAHDIRYDEAARFFAQKLGADSSLVESNSARQRLGSDSFIPNYTSLATSERPDPYQALTHFLNFNV